MPLARPAGQFSGGTAESLMSVACEVILLHRNIFTEPVLSTTCRSLIQQNLHIKVLVIKSVYIHVLAWVWYTTPIISQAPPIQKRGNKGNVGPQIRLYYDTMSRSDNTPSRSKPVMFNSGLFSTPTSSSDNSSGISSLGGFGDDVFSSRYC